MGTSRKNADQIAIEVPTGAAIPNARELAKSLRPLKRTVPSRARLVFDEDATVAAAAEERILRAIERPAGERWLRLALVEDVGPSMALWRQTIDEFASMLAGSGIFFNLTRWSIAIDANSAKLTARGVRSDKHNPDELLEPTGRQIILILTDLVSEGWHNGTGARFIAPWAEHGVLSMVQMLPPSMWRRTGLRDAHHLWLNADPSLHGRLTGLELSEDPFDEPDLTPDETASFPILNLGTDWLSNWSRLLSGRAQVTARGVKLPLHSQGRGRETSSTAETALDQALRSFRGSTSPGARKLAAYCAAVPLTLPVLRLVQNVMMPNGSQPELAEVLLSGLIRRLEHSPLDDDEPVYDFIPGAREQLLSSVPTSDVLFLLTRISDFISVRINHPINFRAWLIDATEISQSLSTAPAEARYFAEISADTLRKLGGKYADLAHRMEAASVSPDVRPAQSTVRSVNAKERSADFERQLDGLRQRIGIYEQSGDIHQRALAWHELGSTQRRHGMLNAAVEAFENASRLWLDQNSVRNYANAIGDAATLLRLLGQWDNCISLLDARGRAAMQLADQKIDVLSKLELARVTADRGYYSEASKHFDLLIQRCASLGFDREAAIARYEHATAKVALGEDARAIASLKQLVEEFTSLGDDTYLGLVYGAIARIEHGQGHLTEARAIQERRIDLLRDQSSQGQYLSAFGDMARVEWDLGKSEAAYGDCRERLFLAGELIDQRERGFALSGLADLERSQGNFASALEMQNERLLLFQELQETRQCSFALVDIARLEHDRGNSERAMKLLREQLSKFEGAGEPRQCAFVKAEMGRISIDTGHKEEALALHEQRFVTFRELSEPREITHALADIARLKARAGELATSVALHQERRQTAANHGYALEEAAALSDVGWQYLQQGEGDQALESFVVALERCDHSRFTRGRAWALAGRAAIERNCGNIDASLAATRERVQILEQTGSPADKAFAWIELGWLLKERGELPESEQLFHRARALVEGSKFSEAAISSRIGLAAFMRDRGELTAAIESYRQGLVACQKRGIVILEIFVSMDLGRALRMQGSSDEAMELFERTLASCQEIGLPRLEGQALTEIGAILAEQGSDAQAVAMFERGLEIATRLELPRDRMTCLAYLGRSRLAVGNVEEAVSLQQERLQISTKLAFPREHAAALQDIGRLNRFKGELVAASERFQQALTMVSKRDTPQAYTYLMLDLALVERDRGAIEEASAIVEEIVGSTSAVFVKRDNAAVLRLRAQLDVQRQRSAGARPMLEEALAIFEQLKARRSIVGVLGDIAELEIRRANFSAAAPVLSEREELLRGLKDPVGESDLLRQKAKLQVMTVGNVDGAVGLADQAAAIAEDVGWLLGVAKANELSGEIRRVRGETTEALERVRRGQDCYRALGNEEAVRRLDALLNELTTGTRRFEREFGSDPIRSERPSHEIGNDRGGNGVSIFSLEIVQARAGSCLLLHFGDSNDRRIILIDGGSRGVYRSQLRPRLEEIKREEQLDEGARLKIDGVLVTCTDDGHVGGLLELLHDQVERNPPIQLDIASLWHNGVAGILYGWPRGPGSETTNQTSRALRSSPALETSNRLLDDARKLGVPLNVPFNGNLIVAGSSTIRLRGGVEFTTLFPTMDDIEGERASASRRASRSKEIIEDELDESDAVAASLSFLVRSGGKRILLAGSAPGDRILQGLERTGHLQQGGSMEVDILTVPMVVSSDQLPIGFFKRMRAQHYVFLGNGEAGTPEREVVEMLDRERDGPANYLVHFSYPLREIDLQREENWNKARAKSRQGRSAQSRRPPWTPEDHALVSFMELHLRFARKVSIGKVGVPHLIDLLEPARR